MIKELEIKSEDKLSYLKENFLFKSLSDRELTSIIDQINFYPMKKGDQLFEKNNKGDKFYLIFAGKIKIFDYNLDGKEQILYIYGNKDFIGIHNLMTEENYQYYGQCIVDGVIGVINKSFFDQYLMKNPKILTSILKMSFKRIRNAEDLIRRLTATSTDEKVSQLLLSLIQSFNTGEASNIIRLNMTRKELASMVGLTRETLTRKLLEYQDKGIIELKGNSIIIIHNMDQLRALSFKK